MMMQQQAAEVPLPNPGGQVAERIQLFALGANRIEYQTSLGRIPDVVWCDSTDIAATLAVFRQQGVALPIFLGHRERNENGEPIGTDNRPAVGWMTLDASASGGVDARVRWTAQGAQLVGSGAYVFDSPEILRRPGPDGRLHLAEIRATALVNQPARSGSRPLVMQTMQKELTPTAKALRGVSDVYASMMTKLQDLAQQGDGEAKTFAENLLGGLAAPQTELRKLVEANIPQQPTEAAQTAEMSAGAPAKPAADPADAEATKLGKALLARFKVSSADEAQGVLDTMLAAPADLSAAAGRERDLLIQVGRMSGAIKADEVDSLKDKSPAYLRGRLRPLGARTDLSADAPQPKLPPAGESGAGGAEVARTRRRMEATITESLRSAGVNVDPFAKA